MKASNSAVPKEKFDWTKVVIHLFLIIAVLLICYPLYYAFVLSTQSIEEVMVTPQKLWPSTHLVENYVKIWNRIDMGQLLFNSAVVSLATSLGKIAISILSAFAIVYFNFRGKQFFF